MATLEVTEKNFDATVRSAIDMDTVRQKLKEAEASAGATNPGDA